MYDPLGWVLPLVMRARIFLRKLWLKAYEWDTPIPKELADDWISIREELNGMNEFRLPRAYAGNGVEGATKLQLHAFCDASKEAYGVVVYLVVIGGGRSWSGVIAAKARLSLKSELSTPRLELLAAAIGSRYSNYLQNTLEIEEKVEKYLWGDSRCVISWVKSNKLLPAFIEKSARQIRESGIESFMYVPTAENPADEVSRGASAQRLGEINWWRGPEWLVSSEKWPDQKLIYAKETKKLASEIEKELCEEESRILLIETAVRLKKNVDPMKNEGAPFGLDPLAFSNIGALIRTTSLAVNFIRRLRRKRLGASLENKDSYIAIFNWWLRWDQRRVYETIENKQRTNVAYLRNLQIKEDEDGIIRCLTRFRWANLPREEIEPILLVKRSALTRQIILSTHENNMHTGTAHTLAALRKRYWLPQGRREVYTVLRKYCHTCRRKNAEPFKAPPMAPLPPFRITKTSRVFENIGLDAFGPYNVRCAMEEGTVLKKRWVIIFTCLITRAIHLEIMTDMKAERFLGTFRKFVARRGVPRMIIADNAPQFHVVDGVFQGIWQRFAEADVTERYYARYQIKWRFIPEHAPWMGGAYERMIQTVKHAFETVYGKLVLDAEQFEISMIEVEAVVNSRPISYVDREAETELITPNDFLCVRHPVIPVNWKEVTPRTPLCELWKKSEQYLEEFWRAWSENYLLAIRERREPMPSGRRDNQKIPKPGELVLMIDPSHKRSSSKMAVIERLIPSEDGEIRAAQIRVNTRSRLIRPITKLASLKLCMDLPEDLPELTPDRRAIVIDDTPGQILI